MYQTQEGAASTGSIAQQQGNSVRTQLILKSVQLAMDAAYGKTLQNEQEITEVLGGLVREKLMSAEDSYRLRDQLLDRKAIDRLIDRQIDRAFLRRQRVMN